MLMTTVVVAAVMNIHIVAIAIVVLCGSCDGDGGWEVSVVAESTERSVHIVQFIETDPSNR